MSGELQFEHTIVCSIDHSISELAAAQHGRVGRWQLVERGMSRRAIQHRVAKGRLIAVARGVYAVGHVVQRPQAVWMAAVLAGGPGALLSHRAAGRAYELRVRGGPVEITVPRRRRVPGAIVHVSSVPGDERTTLDGIPLTTRSRTLLDVATVAAPPELRRALNEAEYLRLTDPTGLPRLLERYPGRRGVTPLRAILADRDLGREIDETELEAEFRLFLAENRLPEPVWQQAVDAYIPDCTWPKHRLIVELDGRQAHATWSRFDSDRARDLRLKAAGWTVVRVTWRMLHREREELARSLRALLAPAPH